VGGGTVNRLTVARSPTTLVRMLFREKVVAIAKDRGLNLKEVARQAGIPYSSLRSYVQPDATGEPTASKALALAKVLGVSVEWLFDPEQDLPAPPYSTPPAIPIYPWPPEGITWEEVRYAIASYILDLHKRSLQSVAQAQALHPVDMHDMVGKVLQSLNDSRQGRGRRGQRR